MPQETAKVCGTYLYDLALKRRAFVEAQRICWSSRILRIFVFGVLPLVLVGIAWMAWREHDYGMFAAAMGSIIWIIMVPLFPYFFVLPRRFRAEPIANTHITVCFSDEGLVLKDVVGESRLSWTAFEDVKELPDHFLFVTHGRQVLLIPKAAFSDDAALDAARKIVAAHVMP